MRERARAEGKREKSNKVSPSQLCFIFSRFVFCNHKNKLLRFYLYECLQFSPFRKWIIDKIRHFYSNFLTVSLCFYLPKIEHFYIRNEHSSFWIMHVDDVDIWCCLPTVWARVEKSSSEFTCSSAGECWNFHLACRHCCLNFLNKTSLRITTTSQAIKIFPVLYLTKGEQSLS